MTDKWRNNILYIDLNSCFATVEQQARPLLRHKPVAVTNRLVSNACIIAASYEAKAKGVKVGMRRADALALCPGLLFAETEPSKYIYVHRKFQALMEEYSAKVVMKSIDEGVLDLSQRPVRDERPAVEVAREIKHRLREEIGCYMRCNVGIAPNRFLAKLAAGLHKPDGLDEITPENLEEVYAGLELTDLPGINVRMERRLNAVEIFTPLEFYQAPEEVLVKMVCRSIDGSKWYKRLRGIEVDDVDYEIKSVGRQYVLESKTLSQKQVEQRVLHLAEDVGYRLRSKRRYARGMQIWAHYYDGTRRKEHYLAETTFSTDATLIALAQKLFRKFPPGIRTVGVTLYQLQAEPSPELSLFHRDVERAERLALAADEINTRFGRRTVHSAETLGTEQVKVKIPFGSTRYLG